MGNSGGGGGSDITRIGLIELAAPAADIDFQNIPATFSALQLVASLRSDRAGLAGVSLAIQLNGSAAAVYDYAYNLTDTQAGGSTTFGANDSDAEILIAQLAVPAALSDADQFAELQFLAPHYAGAHNKSGYLDLGSFLTVATETFRRRWGSWGWRDVAPIDRIRLFCAGGGNFVAGSHAALYGLK